MKRIILPEIGAEGFAFYVDQLYKEFLDQFLTCFGYFVQFDGLPSMDRSMDGISSNKREQTQTAN